MIYQLTVLCLIEQIKFTFKIPKVTFVILVYLSRPPQILINLLKLLLDEGGGLLYGGEGAAAAPLTPPADTHEYAPADPAHTANLP